QKGFKAGFSDRGADNAGHRASVVRLQDRLEVPAVQQIGVADVVLPVRGGLHASGMRPVPKHGEVQNFTHHFPRHPADHPREFVQVAAHGWNSPVNRLPDPVTSRPGPSVAGLAPPLTQCPSMSALNPCAILISVPWLTVHDTLCVTVSTSPAALGCPFPLFLTPPNGRCPSAPMHGRFTYPIPNPHPSPESRLVLYFPSLPAMAHP